MAMLRLLTLLLTVCVLSFVARAQEEKGDASAQTQVSKTTGPPAFFLQDPTDGMCLAGDRYKRCSIETLWYVTGKSGAYSIHHRLVDDADEDEVCMGKAQCHLDESPVQLANCGHCGAKKWNIVGDNDSGYFLTEDQNKNCLKRVGDKAMVMKCDKGSTGMSLQCTYMPSSILLSAVGSLFSLSNIMHPTPPTHTTQSRPRLTFLPWVVMVLGSLLQQQTMT